MNMTAAKRWTLVSLLCLVLFPCVALAQTTFRHIVVFGDSLSDPGNVFALTGEQNTPPYDDPDRMDSLLIPGAPYAVGGHHFSNGATWVEQLAGPLGLAGNAGPAFQASTTEATNYAVGGARAHDDGIHVNLSAQVNAFLNAKGNAIPLDALYVVEFGGNDIRDALGTGTAQGAAEVITQAMTQVGNNIGVLYSMGARKFLVLNAPDLGLTPAVLTLDKLQPGAAQFASLISQAFNSSLNGLLGMLALQLPGIEIVQVDLSQTVHDLVADPEAYGLTVVNSACIMPEDPPFQCQTADAFLFWDGIHPTRAVHTILAQTAATALAK